MSKVCNLCLKHEQQSHLMQNWMEHKPEHAPGIYGLS